MKHLSFPESKIWDNRANWFDIRLETNLENGSFLISEHVSVLSSELRAAYACGLRHTTLILSVAIIDAQLRDIELPDHKGNTKSLTDELGFNCRFDVIRRRRNELIHFDPNKTTIGSSPFIVGSIKS